MDISRSARREFSKDERRFILPEGPKRITLTKHLREKRLVEGLKSESGYSLVEVMVAIMLLAIAIIPMVSMFDAGLRAAVRGGNYDQARALANEKLEEIRALPYSSPGESASGTANSVVEIYPPGTRSCTGSVDPNFGCQVQTRYVMLNPGSASVDPSPSSKTMMEATVTVTWSGGRSYSTTGLVAKGTR